MVSLPLYFLDFIIKTKEGSDWSQWESISWGWASLLIPALRKVWAVGGMKPFRKQGHLSYINYLS